MHPLMDGYFNPFSEEQSFLADGSTASLQRRVIRRAITEEICRMLNIEAIELLSMLLVGHFVHPCSEALHKHTG